MICSECKKETTDYIVTSGYSVLCPECAKKQGCVLCSHCLRMTPDYMTVVGPDGKPYCWFCFGHRFHTCDECRAILGTNWHKAYKKKTCDGIISEQHVCEECLKKYYTQCKVCGRYWHNENIHDGYCFDCARKSDYQRGYEAAIAELSAKIEKAS